MFLQLILPWYRCAAVAKWGLLCCAGQMGDAAEVLTALYEKLAGVAAQAGEPSMLDDNFGLHVKVRNVFTVPF